MLSLRRHTKEEEEEEEEESSIPYIKRFQFFNWIISKINKAFLFLLLLLVHHFWGPSRPELFRKEDLKNHISGQIFSSFIANFVFHRKRTSLAGSFKT